MEMVPITPGARERQRLSRAIRPKDPTLSDPLLAISENSQGGRRGKPPTFGDPYNFPIHAYSSYQPPEPLGLDIEPQKEQANVFDDYLFFNSPPPRSRSLQRRPYAQRLLHHENPAKDMANCLSYGCCCMQCVRTQEIGIIENFGQFQEILAPGLYCLPWPLTDIAGRLSLRVQQLDVVCETKTKDNGAQFGVLQYECCQVLYAHHCPLVFVHVQVSVQYRVLVEKSYDAFYRLSDPGVQIRSYAFDVIRSTIPRMTVDQAFVSKSTIAETLLQRLFEIMREYGYEIIGALVTNLTPDEKVKASMNEIEASKRLKAAIPHRAEAGTWLSLLSAALSCYFPCLR